MAPPQRPSRPSRTTPRMATLLSVAATCYLLSLTSTSPLQAVEASPIPGTKEQLQWFASQAVLVDQDPISLMILPRKRSIASFSSSPSSSSNAASRSKDTTKKAAAVVAAKAAALNLKEGRDLSSAASVIIVKGTAPNFSEQRLKRQRQHSSSSSSLYSAYEAIVNSDSQMPVFLTHDRITRQGKKKPVAVKSLAENQTHSKPLRPFVRVAVPSPSSDGDMAQVDNNNKEEEEDELVEGKAKAQVDVEEEMDHSALIQEEADYSNNSEMEDRDTAAEPDNYISAATLSYDTMDTTVEEVVGSTDDGDGDAEDIDLLGNRVAAPAPAPAPPSTLPASDDAYDDNEETRVLSPSSISALSEPERPRELDGGDAAADDDIVHHSANEWPSSDRVINIDSASPSRQQTKEDQQQLGDRVLHDFLLKIALPNTIHASETHDDDNNDKLPSSSPPLRHDTSNPYTPEHSTLQWPIAGLLMAVLYLGYRTFKIRRSTGHSTHLPFAQQPSSKGCCTGPSSPQDEKQMPSFSSSSSTGGGGGGGEEVMAGTRNRSFSNSSSTLWLSSHAA